MSTMEEQFRAILESAAQAAEAAKKAAEAVASQRPQTQNNLYKVVDKPPVFSPKNREEELAQWPDWKFGLINYLSGVLDPKYREELEYIERHNDTPINSDELHGDDTKSRNEQLFIILSTMLAMRPLRVVKALGAKMNRSGFEAFRLLVKENEPSLRARSVALNLELLQFRFEKSKSFLESVLEFECKVETYENCSGELFSDNSKIGVLFMNAPQQLRNHVKLTLREDSTYDDIREAMLHYETTRINWLPSSKDGATPMEVDRVGGKGKDKGKDKGKGKGKDKGKGKGKYGNGKGKGGGKQDPNLKDKQCHTCGKYGHLAKDCRSGGKGKNSNQKGSGKGKQNKVTCHNCGKQGHYAKDCWGKKVRQVEGETEQSNASNNSNSNNTSEQKPTSSSSSSGNVQQRIRRVVQQFDLTGNDIPVTELPPDSLRIRAVKCGEPRVFDMAYSDMDECWTLEPELDEYMSMWDELGDDFMYQMDTHARCHFSCPGDEALCVSGSVKMMSSKHDDDFSF